MLCYMAKVNAILVCRLSPSLLHMSDGRLLWLMVPAGAALTSVNALVRLAYISVCRSTAAYRFVYILYALDRKLGKADSKKETRYA